MKSNNSDKNISKKWKQYITSVMRKNLNYSDISDKYFKSRISESTVKAIEENWNRLVGLDFEIISVNLDKRNSSLGIALYGKSKYNSNHVLCQHHHIRNILPKYCIGATNLFKVGDEILEVNGLKVQNLTQFDVFKALKKLPNNFQIVVGRKLDTNLTDNNELNHSEDNLIDNVNYCDLDQDDVASKCSTLRSVTSNYSTTSRDFIVSVDDLNVQQSTAEYLRNIDGWRGPLVIELRKSSKKESLGIGLEEIPDPRTGHPIVVFKMIHPQYKAGLDGRLHVGDRLLQVNGKSCEGVLFRKVCQWLKSAPKGRVILYVCQPHFKPIGFDHLVVKQTELYSPTLDRVVNSTGDRMSTLPRLNEEMNNDHLSNEIPGVPESMEKHITIKRIPNQPLGIFFQTEDGGRHGCRIKRLVDGLILCDARLHEGDYVTNINGVNWRVADKQQLDFCIKQITATTYSDTIEHNVYKISFVTGQDVASYKRSYIAHNYPQNTNYRPETMYYNVNGDCKYLCIEVTLTKTSPDQSCGLILGPSLTRPKYFVSIVQVMPDSAAHNAIATVADNDEEEDDEANDDTNNDISSCIHINDDLVAVNGHSFHNLNSEQAGHILKNLWALDQTLVLKIERFVGYSAPDQDAEQNCHESASAPEDTKSHLINKYPFLEQFPDLYFCSFDKGSAGYGFSIKSIKGDNRSHKLGVMIDTIEENSAADNCNKLTCGDRFVLINNICVVDVSAEIVVGIIKNSSYLSLVMERPKYLEFNVDIVKDEHNSLGINVAGGTDTSSPVPKVQSLVPNSKSQFSREIFPDDEIIAAENKSLLVLTHLQLIEALRSTQPQTKLCIRRQLQYIDRGQFFNQLEIFDNDLEKYLEFYCQRTQLEIELSRQLQQSTASLNSVGSYGLDICDVVVIDASDCGNCLARYKVIYRVAMNSLADKYAPSLRHKMPFIQSINNSPIDSDQDSTGEQIKLQIDRCDQVHLQLSIDVPYYAIAEKPCHTADPMPDKEEPLLPPQEPYQSASPDLLDNHINHHQNNLSDEEDSTLNLKPTNPDVESIEEVLPYKPEASSSLTDSEIQESREFPLPPPLEANQYVVHVDEVDIPIVNGVLGLQFKLLGGRDESQGGNDVDLPLFVVGVSSSKPMAALTNGDQLIKINQYNLNEKSAREAMQIIEQCLQEDLTHIKVKYIRLNNTTTNHK